MKNYVNFYFNYLGIYRNRGDKKSNIRNMSLKVKTVLKYIVFLSFFTLFHKIVNVCEKMSLQTFVVIS